MLKKPARDHLTYNNKALKTNTHTETYTDSHIYVETKTVIQQHSPTVTVDSAQRICSTIYQIKTICKHMPDLTPRNENPLLRKIRSYANASVTWNK